MNLQVQSSLLGFTNVILIQFKYKSLILSKNEALKTYYGMTLKLQNFLTL